LRNQADSTEAKIGRNSSCSASIGETSTEGGGCAGWRTSLVSYLGGVG
jgi:hypothetical protein